MPQLTKAFLTIDGNPISFQMKYIIYIAPFTHKHQYKAIVSQCTADTFEARVVANGVKYVNAILTVFSIGYMHSSHIGEKLGLFSVPLKLFKSWLLKAIDGHSGVPNTA